MRAPHELLLIVAAAASACKGSPTIAVEPPPDVTHVVLVELTESGDVVSASELSVWRPGEPLPIVASGSSVMIGGYTDAQLSAFGGSDTLDAARGQRLRLARGCEQTLPPPAWQARWSEDGAIETDLGAPPRLTATWLQNACPTVTASTAVGLDLRCRVARCVPQATQVRRCELALDLFGCGLGTARATVHAGGRLCIDFSDSDLTCEPRDRPAAASGAYACDTPMSCDVDAYWNPASAASPFSLDRAPVLNVEPYTAGVATRLQTIYPATTFQGYAYDLALIGDEVAIITVDDVTPKPTCPSGDGSQQGTLLQFLNQESLTIVRTATAPRCLNRLASTPDGSALLGTFGTTDEWQVGRFDRTGRVTMATRTGVHFWGTREARRLHELRVLEDEQHFVMLFGFRRGEREGDALLLTYNIATMREVTRLRVDNNGLSFNIAAMQGTTLALIFDDSRRVLYVDALDGTIVERVELSSAPEIASSLFGAYHDPATQRLLIGSGGVQQLVSVEPEGREVSEFVAWQRDMTSIVPFSWPRAEARVAIAGAWVPEWRAAITLFDPDGQRFAPGTYDVGHGIVSRVRQSDSGRTWLLLPWAAEVVRLTPR